MTNGNNNNNKKFLESKSKLILYIDFIKSMYSKSANTKNAMTRSGLNIRNNNNINGRNKNIKLLTAEQLLPETIEDCYKLIKYFEKALVIFIRLNPSSYTEKSGNYKGKLDNFMKPFYESLCSYVYMNANTPIPNNLPNITKSFINDAYDYIYQKLVGHRLTTYPGITENLPTGYKPNVNKPKGYKPKPNGYKNVRPYNLEKLSKIYQGFLSQREK